MTGFIYYLLPDTYHSEQKLTVPASSRSAYTLDWQKDWEQIRRHTGEYITVQDLRMN
jgi:hypothetical protein